MGYAIRTLREEFPVIFYREPSFDIYRTGSTPFVGIDNYRRIFWALRISGRMFFKALWLDIVSIWQPAENVVMIRWIVHGIPRVPWDSHGRFDGTSEFKLDGDGKIFEHRVDNVAVNSPPNSGSSQWRSSSSPSAAPPPPARLSSSWRRHHLPFRPLPAPCSAAVWWLLLGCCSSPGGAPAWEADERKSTGFWAPPSPLKLARF
ncbi:unnamed protein product [Spirodela intermedia]|uniref:Uncharacterized protein n=1 Tax=Spirodela intermedia TaxID=51605 RepID=A0A7I8ITA3_SPIIN|nr:unnamed protein product [Spirodela intermedia]CAA6661024.1 unnamed protein product [Spirodela intermedia]